MHNDIWRRLVRKHALYDVPDELAACRDCPTAHCPHGQYDACRRRLQDAVAQAERRAADAADGIGRLYRCP
jgi:hypothetical protein